MLYLFRNNFLNHIMPILSESYYYDKSNISKCVYNILNIKSANFSVNMVHIMVVELTVLMNTHPGHGSGNCFNFVWFMDLWLCGLWFYSLFLKHTKTESLFLQTEVIQHQELIQHQVLCALSLFTTMIF